MRHPPTRQYAPFDAERALSSPNFEKLAAVEANGRIAAAQDRLMIKARHIFDLVQKRARHFQHPLMADRAMGVMLSLFLAEFSATPKDVAAVECGESGDEQNVIASLLGAGLIDMPVDDASDRRFVLTPLGAGRMRSFISAYPEQV